MLARVPHLVTVEAVGPTTDRRAEHARRRAEAGARAPPSAAKRVGRGTGGHGGKTAGRGTKGQRARNTVARGFEGGQMPLKQRVPKLKGFNNPFRIEYQAINLDVLEAREQYSVAEITPATLHAHGLVHKGALVKVLGRGELTRAVRVRPTASRRRLKRPSRPQAVPSRSCPCPTAPAGRRPRATSSPTADPRPARSRLPRSQACSPA